MKSAGSQPDHYVPRPDAIRARDRRAFGEAYGETGDVIFTGPVEARHLRSFAAHQAHPGELASARDAFHQRLCDAALELAGRDVIEEEQRTRGVTYDVVNAHR